MTKQIGTCSKKGRGKAQRSLDLIEAMYDAAEAAQPITGRGIGYKLFTAGLIPSMARKEMQRVYRLLKEARDARLDVSAEEPAAFANRLDVFRAEISKIAP